jgi:hypothetical protein
MVGRKGGLAGRQPGKSGRLLLHPVKPFAARRDHRPPSTPEPTAQTDPNTTFNVPRANVRRWKKQPLRPHCPHDAFAPVIAVRDPTEVSRNRSFEISRCRINAPRPRFRTGYPADAAAVRRLSSGGDQCGPNADTFRDSYAAPLGILIICAARYAAHRWPAEHGPSRRKLL